MPRRLSFTREMAATQLARPNKPECQRILQQELSTRPAMHHARSEIRIGISGWTYRLWRGNLYPEKLPHKHELAFASRRFNSIEINGTHYSLQRPSSFALWDAVTPSGFVFAVKGSRYITHMLKLREVEAPLANFFASGLLRLGAKLGPILWQ